MSKRPLVSSTSDHLVSVSKRTQLFPTYKDAPLLNSAPKTMLPIVQPPLKVADFFTDLAPQTDEKSVSDQIQAIVKLFPPPPLPNYITHKYSNGIMVPFIYPPPPTYKDQLGVETFILLPPLPFPPPNYMPYPLVSDDASLTPDEVFSALLEALKILPRIDMVLASAAGSLLDMRSQADLEGFTISGFEVMKRLAEEVQEREKQEQKIQQEQQQQQKEQEQQQQQQHQQLALQDQVKSEILERALFTVDAELEAAATAAAAATRRPRRRGRPSKNAYKEEMEAIAAQKTKFIEASLAARNAAYENSAGLGSRKVDTRTKEEKDYDEYKAFAMGVDLSYEEDPLAVNGSNVIELKNQIPGYDTVKSVLSDLRLVKDLGIKNGSKSNDRISIKNNEFSSKTKGSSPDIELQLPLDSDELLGSNFRGLKEILSGNGLNKERRRDELNRSMHELKQYQDSHKASLYQALKKQRLDRLHELNSISIRFDTKDKEITDSQLLADKTRLEEARDDELVRLRLFADYQLLNNALTFYRELSKVYKTMNQLVLNKMKKLQNFFEFQKQAFTKALENEAEASIFDIKTKDATRLYAGIATKDIGTFLKDTAKAGGVGVGDPEMRTPIGESFVNGQDELVVDNKYHGPDKVSESSTPITSLLEEDVFRLATGKLAPPSSLVHDFIPLVSQEEFNMITGDLPKYKNGGVSGSEAGSSSQKGVLTQNLKHLVFLSSLYDPLTSGSDTASEASSAAPKRRGRRAANPPSGPGDKLIDNNDKLSLKLSEALLLARIMKHYVPPLGAKPDELNEDLEQLGIRTRWPVNR